MTINIASLATAPSELIDSIYTQCLVYGDINDVFTLATTCQRLHSLGITLLQNLTSNFIKSIKLEKSFKKLCIIDTGILNNLENNPIKINMLTVLEAYKHLAPHVENRGDLALVILRQGTTFNQLLSANPQMKGNIGWAKISSELGSSPLEKTCVGLMTCTVLVGTRDKSLEEQEKIVEQHHPKCKIPTIYQYLAVCTAPKGRAYPKEPPTYGISSTEVEDKHLVAGGCSTTSKTFVVMGSDPRKWAEHRGAGAWLPL